MPFVQSSCFLWSVLPLRVLLMLGMVYKHRQKRKKIEYETLKQLKLDNYRSDSDELQIWWHWNSSSFAEAEQQRLFTIKQSNFANKQQTIPSRLSSDTAVPQHEGRLFCFLFFHFKGKLWLTFCFVFSAFNCIFKDLLGIVWLTHSCISHVVPFSFLSLNWLCMLFNKGWLSFSEHIPSSNCG